MIGWHFGVVFFRGHGFLGVEAMATFITNSDYEEKDSDPIRLEPGDEVTTGPADQAWPGWVWATDAAGNDGYVPEMILKAAGQGRFSVTEAFDPTVLTIRRGDRIESTRSWISCGAGLVTASTA